MTNMRSAIDMMREFDRYFVGLDQHVNKLNRVSTTQNFPPYNIRKVKDDRYVVEFAVAGYDEEDIDITVEDGILVVKGKAQEDTNAQQYLHRGISKRAFTQSIGLGEHIEVHGAELHNGMLSIGLVHVVPEEKKPKRIEIRKPVPIKELLQE